MKTKEVVLQNRTNKTKHLGEIPTLQMKEHCDAKSCVLAKCLHKGRVLESIIDTSEVCVSI